MIYFTLSRQDVKPLCSSFSGYILFVWDERITCAVCSMRCTLWCNTDIDSDVRSILQWNKQTTYSQLCFNHFVTIWFFDEKFCFTFNCTILPHVTNHLVGKSSTSVLIGPFLMWILWRHALVCKVLVFPLRLLQSCRSAPRVRWMTTNVQRQTETNQQNSA